VRSSAVQVQRWVCGTPAITFWTWAPQPDQVALPQVRQVTRRHIGVLSGRRRPRGGRTADDEDDRWCLLEPVRTNRSSGGRPTLASRRTWRAGMAGARISDLAGFLLGAWRLDREVVDTAGRRLTGHFTGTAWFTADHHAAGLLRYLEQGHVPARLPPGSCLPAAALRRRWRASPGGVRRRARLPRPRPPRGGVRGRAPLWRRPHRGRFEVDDAARWRQTWTATGPGKHQVIRTVLERAVEPSAGRLTLPTSSAM
jgi:hypothetical protein